jgi:hypothetical protein
MPTTRQRSKYRNRSKIGNGAIGIYQEIGTNVPDE